MPTTGPIAPSRLSRSPSTSQNRTAPRSIWCASRKFRRCRSISRRSRQTTKTAARRFHAVVERAHAMASQRQVNVKTHILAGHPVRVVTDLAQELGADLLVIGRTGHSALYERLIGSRADRMVQLAHCPVLVAK